MNLVGYTTTALSRNDIIDTPTNKNVVDGAIVELKDYDGNLVTIYDDINGTNPETQKTCDTNGQCTFFAEAGDYVLEVNGQPQNITISVNITVVNDVSSQRIWGDRYKGELTADVGVTLTDEFSVLLYDGNYYSYTGSDPFPVIVASGTVPTAPDYKLRNPTDHDSDINRNAVGAHDDVYIRDVTLAEAQAEDAPVGTRYTITDFDCARYDVVAISDSGGYYISLSATKKLKLVFSSLVNFGHLNCVLDGITDNTTELLSFLSALPKDSTLSIYIPNNLKYDFNQVTSALPLRCNVTDDSSVNGWDSTGFRQKILQVYEKGDASAIVDLNQVLSSGHNASHILENTGESGSISGDKRVVSWSWSSGRFKQDEPGLRLMARNEYAKSAVRDDIWAYSVRKRAPWLAKDYEIWRTGQAFAVDDVCLANSTKRYYKALNSGNAGATEPSHTSGSASDGSVTWEVLDVSAFDATVFYMDELGRLATNTGAGVGYTQRWKQAPQDIENMHISWEATGTSKSVRLSLRPTDGAGNAVDLPQILASSTGSVRGVSSSLTEEFFRLSDSRGFELGAYGHREITVTNGDATPSVLGVGVVAFNNSSPSNVTGFDDGKATQEITVISANANTTLINSATLKLKGGVDAPLPAFGVLTLVRWSGSSAWLEKSRSF